MARFEFSDGLGQKLTSAGATSMSALGHERRFAFAATSELPSTADKRGVPSMVDPFYMKGRPDFPARHRGNSVESTSLYLPSALMRWSFSSIATATKSPLGLLPRGGDSSS